MPVNKFKKWLVLTILIAGSISINVYMRLNTLRLDSFYQITKESVHAKISANLEKHLNENYPTIASATKQRFSKSLLDEYLIKNKEEVSGQIAKDSQEAKEVFFDANGMPYLLEIDPYRWMRRIDNFLNTGHFGTSIKNGIEWDNLQFTPFGRKVEPIRFHYYLGAFFYKLLNFLNDKISLMNALAFYPVFLSSIMVVAIFFFCGTFGISRWSGFIASVVIGLSEVLLVRSSLGWFDTDLYNIIFALFIVSVLARGLNFETKAKKYVFLLISAFLVGIYSAFWATWWLVFFCIIFGLFLYKLEFIIYDECHNLFPKIKDSFLIMAFFIIFSYLFVFLISGLSAIKNSFLEPLLYMKARTGLTIENFWPDIAFSIAELKRPSIPTAIKACGGNVVVFGGIIGLILLFILKRRVKGADQKRFLLFILFAWLLAGIFLSFFGTRFLIFLVIPLGIPFAMLWDLLAERRIINRKLSWMPQINRKVLILPIVFILMVLPSIKNVSALNLFPMMNDVWFNMLEKIEKNTPKNAVINTQWDYGDYIMTISKRATLYDASWQYTPVAYWISRALISQNEEEAMGIFRMLDSGGNLAFDELYKIIKDKILTFNLVNKMISMNENDSRELLNKYVKDKEKLIQILKLMYGPPPPGYVLLADRILDTMLIMSSVANWDFKKSEAWQKFNQLNKEDFINYAVANLGYSHKEIQQLYSTMALMDISEAISWIANSGYRFYFVRSAQLMNDENLVIFDSGIIFDKKAPKVYLVNDFFKVGATIPGCLFLVEGDTMKEYAYSDGNANYTAFILKNGDEYESFLVDAPLAKSLLVKLYFLRGKGLKRFELVAEQKNKDTPYRMYLYKINWPDSKKGVK